MPSFFGCSERGNTSSIAWRQSWRHAVVGLRDGEFAVDRNSFDEVTRIFGTMTRRRALATILGVAAATPVIGLLIGAPEDVAANTAGRMPRPRKPKKARPKKRLTLKQKRTYCLNGKTVQSKRKHRIRRWERQGATRGKCPAAKCDVSCPSRDPVACGEALRAAIANGGTIRVCPGIYEGPFPLTVDVEIIGAGSRNNPAVATILSGAAGRGAVVPVTTAITVRLASMRITGGNGSSDDSGGVYVNKTGASVTIDRCALVGNTGSYGGGASVYNGELTITGSEISGNTASNGGGIATAKVLTVESTRITGNTAADAGGGIFLNSGTTTLGAGVTISGNTSGGDAGTGGGIYKLASSSTINNLATVTNNTPDQCAGNGFVFTCP